MKPYDPTVDRLCECGCGESLAGRRPDARYATDQCRARAWKARNHYGAQKRSEGRTNGSQGGLQVSYRKAVDALAADLAWMLPHGDKAIQRRMVEKSLFKALSDRQRQRLESR